METKQVIVMRKDLNMRKGKIVAQGCHASLAAVLNQGQIVNTDQYNENKGFYIPINDEFNTWLTGRFTKICVSVDSEQELLDVYAKANEDGLPCSLIRDAGLTEFNGVQTYTAVAIGPAFSDRIDKITGHLKLL